MEELPEHTFYVFTYGPALDYLRHSPHLQVQRIPGFQFRYVGGRISYLASLAANGWLFLHDCREEAARIAALARRARADLFITDFEPVLARAAGRSNRPLLSLDNQHRFRFCRLDDLPTGLRWYARAAGVYARALVPDPVHAIIATFHAERLEPRTRMATVVPGCVRRGLRDQPRSRQGYVVAYLRPSIAQRVLPLLEELEQEVRVYGVSPDRQRFGRLQFRKTSARFLEDLAHCSWVVGTAGNQLLSEARYCGKPVLAIPEPAQYEQYVNAFYAEHCGMGQACDLGQLDVATLRRFLDDSAGYAPLRADGAQAAARIVRAYLG